MGRRILITGAKGFIGANVATWFQQKGDIIFGVDKKNASVNKHVNRHFLEKYAEYNLPTPKFGYEVENWKPDILIHCAGGALVSSSVVDPGKDFTNSVEVFFNVLDTVRKVAPFCKVIFPSSAAVYGEPYELPIKESFPLTPMSPYGYHKQICEIIAREFYTLYGVQVTLLRIFSVYGPGLRKQVLWDISRKAIDDSVVKLFGTGEETRDFIYIEDIALAVEQIISKAPFQAESYNVASGTELSIRNLAEHLLRALKINKEIQFTGKTREGDPNRWRADISKLRGLGFEPSVSWQVGVEKYAHWIKQLSNS